MARAKLSQAARTFVVQRLACFDSPSIVVAAVKKEFGIEITRQAVEAFDPTKRAGKDLAAMWRALFEETRKTFLEDTAAIGISHRSVRLRSLDRMATRAYEMGNFQLAAQILRQAAEEMGGVYTNRRELTGKDGKDLPAPPAPVHIFSLPDNGRGDGPAST